MIANSSHSVSRSTILNKSGKGTRNCPSKETQRVPSPQIANFARAAALKMKAVTQPSQRSNHKLLLAGPLVASSRPSNSSALCRCHSHFAAITRSPAQQALSPAICSLQGYCWFLREHTKISLTSNYQLPVSYKHVWKA